MQNRIFENDQIPRQQTVDCQPPRYSWHRVHQRNRGAESAAERKPAEFAKENQL